MLLAKPIAQICLVPFSQVKSRTFANAYNNRGICLQGPCKRTQHCWPTNSNIVGCYTLRPFAHPVACCCLLLGVVAQKFKTVKLFGKCKRTQQLLKLLAQKCWELLRPFARSVKYLGSSKYVRRGVARILERVAREETSLQDSCID